MPDDQPDIKTLAYHLSPEEVDAFHQFILARYWRPDTARIWMVAKYIICYVALLAWLVKVQEFPLLLAVLVSTTSFGGLIAYLAARDNEKWRRMKATPTVNQMRVNAAGLHLGSDDFDMRMAWKNIAGLAKKGELVIFLIDEVTATAVPVAAFESPQHRETFILAAEAYLRAAKSGVDVTSA
ncbi:hypothetical protein ABAC460_02480 [Asticcacaulis sp. AC460]|uniref:YcxB family protein n=1 Tax=Asticcacaulis sp. AC460 TaxID=1282360 RepID=UPI0003C41302|nr:YcxB family protein [Asticcacaulis sp. AC460]ESQ92715.1 hypothetical protein ABAC460_02480 [Asticcacaulis sp. AC460]